MSADSVDLVYLDPPFNTGRDFGEFDDRWKHWTSDEEEVFPDLMTLAFHHHGTAMENYLKFMAIRLLEMKRS